MNLCKNLESKSLSIKTVKYIGNWDLIEDRRRMRSDLSSSSASHVTSSYIPSSAPQPSTTISTTSHDPTSSIDITSNPPPSSDDQPISSISHDITSSIDITSNPPPSSDDQPTIDSTSDQPY